MLTRHFAFAAVVIAATLQAACFPDYLPRRKAKDIADSQVIGTWQMRAASAEKFLAYPAPAGTKSAVEFASDGRCWLRNFVNNGDLFSGEGTWKLAGENDRGGSRYSVLEIDLPSSNGGRSHVFRFYFARGQQGLILWQYIGDPDSREYVEYERV
jgi:hypothetical protein